MRPRFAALALLVVTSGPVSAAGDPPGWTLALAPGKTAVDGALRIFPGSTMDDGELVLKDEKWLRLPGTSKERAYVPPQSRLRAPTSVTVRAQGRSLRPATTTRTSS